MGVVVVWKLRAKIAEQIKGDGMARDGMQGHGSLDSFHGANKRFTQLQYIQSCTCVHDA